MTVTLRIDPIPFFQADMRDVAFYFRKKSGFPKLMDSGLADVVLGGQGLTAVVHLVSADKDKTCVFFTVPSSPYSHLHHPSSRSIRVVQALPQRLQRPPLYLRSPSITFLPIDLSILIEMFRLSSSVFKVKNVNVKVDSLKFSIRDSKHDTLYKTLRPLATGLVKRQIQKAVEDAITTGMEYVDGQLVGVRDRMREASASPDTNRTQVLQDLFKRNKDQGADVASKASTKSASQFKVVSKRDSAILPEAGHPSGWANRAQDRNDAAHVGDGWKSEA